MPISPEIVEDAESLITWFPFRAASAQHAPSCLMPGVTVMLIRSGYRSTLAWQMEPSAPTSQAHPKLDSRMLRPDTEIAIAMHLRIGRPATGRCCFFCTAFRQVASPKSTLRPTTPPTTPALTSTRETPLSWNAQKVYCGAAFLSDGIVPHIGLS